MAKLILFFAILGTRLKVLGLASLFYNVCRNTLVKQATRNFSKFLRRPISALPGNGLKYVFSFRMSPWAKLHCPGPRAEWAALERGSYFMYYQV